MLTEEMYGQMEAVLLTWTRPRPPQKLPENQPTSQEGGRPWRAAEWAGWWTRVHKLDMAAIAASRSCSAKGWPVAASSSSTKGGIAAAAIADRVTMTNGMPRAWQLASTLFAAS